MHRLAIVKILGVGLMMTMAAIILATRMNVRTMTVCGIMKMRNVYLEFGYLNVLMNVLSHCLPLTFLPTRMVHVELLLVRIPRVIYLI